MKTRIMEFRKEKKVTQEELADAVNVTRQTIISLEEMFLFDKEDENL